MQKEIRQREITPDAFRAFLVWLSPQKIEDGEAYEKARRRLVIFFASRQCRDPEAHADATVDIAIHKLSAIPTEIPPLAYLLGIAKNVFRDYLRKLQHEASALEGIQQNRIPPQPEIERNHTCLEGCLNELPSDERATLLSYYSQDRIAKIELHRRLAEQQNLTVNALRNRIFRLNKRMAQCLEKCREDFSV